MRISLSWLQTFIHLPSSPQVLDNLLTFSGLEVESIHQHDFVRGGLQGLVVGKVISAAPHPNADKLRICMVDTGAPALAQIVCGAANVAAGQKVVVALPGAILYPTVGEPFEIKKSKIRGEESLGMICAEDEIGLGTGHEGIIVLDTLLPAGAPAAQYFQLESDTVFEIGLTPNRGDAASHLGTARDLAALLQRPLQEQKAFHFKPSSVVPNPYQVTIAGHDLACNYSCFLVRGVAVGPSPKWLADRLSSIGVASINNLVDITNYFCHSLGQPMHAFDADKLTGTSIEVRLAGTPSEFIALDGKTIKLAEQDLCIADSSGPIALAGVMGGASTAISASTTNVLFEVACFSPTQVRRTASRTGIRSDSSFRFERGIDPAMQPQAAAAAMELLSSLFPAAQFSTLSSAFGLGYQATTFQPREITVGFAALNSLIGQHIENDTVVAILQNLGYGIQLVHEFGHQGFEANFVASVPSWKYFDVATVADIAEEVLRIYGINNIAIAENVAVPFFENKFSWHKADVAQKVSNFLTANAFVEIVTNSITSQARQLFATDVVHLANPLSEELNQMRQSPIGAMLEAMAYNANRRAKVCSLFEFGNSYHLTPDSPTTDPFALSGYTEREHLIIGAWGTSTEESAFGKAQSASFYSVSHAVARLFAALGLPFQLEDSPSQPPYGFGLAIVINGKTIGNILQVGPKILKQYDLKGNAFVADIQWASIVKATKKKSIAIAEPSKFPEVRRDLSFVLPEAVTYADLKKAAEQAEKKLLSRLNIFDVFSGGALGEGKKAYAISFFLLDSAATLTDASIESAMAKIENAITTKFAAVVRR